MGITAPLSAARHAHKVPLHLPRTCMHGEPLAFIMMCLSSMASSTSYCCSHSRVALWTVGASCLIWLWGCYNQGCCSGPAPLLIVVSAAAACGGWQLRGSPAKPESSLHAQAIGLMHACELSYIALRRTIRKPHAASAQGWYAAAVVTAALLQLGDSRGKISLRQPAALHVSNRFSALHACAVSPAAVHSRCIAMLCIRGQQKRTLHLSRQQAARAAATAAFP